MESAELTMKREPSLEVSEQRGTEDIGRSSSDSSTETFTYEVQHETERYVYFNLVDNDEPTRQNFRATVKAMKRHGLPTFERRRFTLTVEQRMRFRFFEKN
ncbi:hypothetical protein R1flu_016612 [Riccia fluitans]|uniref:Uncharacterized protein n=1 Tax=Riccia fluitans TaxID=41844 RepID=A0ABD1YMV1_9MARC